MNFTFIQQIKINMMKEKKSRKQFRFDEKKNEGHLNLWKGMTKQTTNGKKMILFESRLKLNCLAAKKTEPLRNHYAI